MVIITTVFYIYSKKQKEKLAKMEVRNKIVLEDLNNIANRLKKVEKDKVNKPIVSLDSFNKAYRKVNDEL